MFLLFRQRIMGHELLCIFQWGDMDISIGLEGGRQDLIEEGWSKYKEHDALRYRASLGEMR